MMANRGLKFVKNGMLMTLLTWLVIGTACNDQLDNPKVNPSNGKQVEVSLNIGFADEDDGISLADTRSNNTAAGEKASTQKLAFDAQLISAVETRAGEAKPDQLYNLEIRQYNASGTCLNSSQAVIANQSIGSRLTISLTESEDCQLVIVAWGTSISNRLGTDTFSKACDVMIDQSAIKDLDPTNLDDMKKMPYYIYLPSVKVSANTITNPDGTDVRLLLKRLATRVTLNWNYAYTTYYDLKEVRLEGVPTHYRAIPFINTADNTYPSLFDQYTTIIVPDNIPNQGSYSCWIPATLRGTSNKATSAYYRNKENAPTGSVYATFVAQNKAEEKKKLNYRLYLGSNTSDNFDLNPNTNYNYQINFVHKSLPTNDRRVSIIDPIDASEGNDFLSPTANCFMVTPGGAFCFNPYKYYVNGENGENTLLQQWCASSKIQSVKVLWQTKENGDLGDPVLGVVNSNNDHKNIVELKNGESFENACIYCRVAPNTSGGNGVIVAYSTTDGTGDALWSWHIWVTDYKPDPLGNETILTPANKRKLKFTYNVPSGGQYPMMDRNLGAMAGYVNETPATPVDRSKTNGFHYQWGRKDPFPSSYSNEDIKDITDISGNKPVKGMLNRYAADGITYFPNINSIIATTTLRNAYAQPNVRYCQGDGSWCSDENQTSLWGTTKTVNDPCPAGWKIISPNNIAAAIGSNYVSPGKTADNWVRNIKNEDTYKDDGGILVYYEAMGSGNRVFMRFTGYPPKENFKDIGSRITLCTSQARVCFTATLKDGEFEFYNISNGWWLQDSHPLRCIQERE